MNNVPIFNCKSCQREIQYEASLTGVIMCFNCGNVDLDLISDTPLINTGPVTKVLQRMEEEKDGRVCLVTLYAIDVSEDVSENVSENESEDASEVSEFYTESEMTSSIEKGNDVLIAENEVLSTVSCKFVGRKENNEEGDLLDGLFSTMYYFAWRECRSMAMPVPKEIIDSIPVINITKEHLRFQGRIDCSACQCNFKVNEKICELQCNHLYHEKCIKDWLSQHNCCFRCYFDVPGDPLSYENRKQKTII